MIDDLARTSPNGPSQEPTESNVGPSRPSEQPEIFLPSLIYAKGESCSTDVDDARKFKLFAGSLANLRVHLHARKALSFAPLVVLENNLPVKFKIGFDSIGELVQLSVDELSMLPRCGDTTLTHICYKIRELGLELGTVIDLKDREKFKIKKVAINLDIRHTGHFADFASGDFAIQLGAREVVGRSLESIPGMAISHFRILQSSTVKTHDGKLKPLCTVGELIQVSVTLPGSRHLHTPINFLLPRGLCVGMRLSDARLEELGLERVTSD